MKTREVPFYKKRMCIGGCGWEIPRLFMVRIANQSYSSFATFVDHGPNKPKDPREGRPATELFVAHECPQCGALMGEDMMYGNQTYDVEAIAAAAQETRAEDDAREKGRQA